MRQVKMMFVPATGKVKYTHAKAYCPISLQSFVQKKIQKFNTKNIRDKTPVNVCYIFKDQPTNHGSPHKPQCTM